MLTFNLVDEPWIPCVLANGPGEQVLSLRATLEAAPRIGAIVDSSPLVTVALHRLLLAVLHRVFGPPDAAAWQALRQRGAWDSTALTRYFDEWRGRFNLFSDTLPFYQTSGLDPAYTATISRLLIERASGKHRTLFDHTTDDHPPRLSPAEAARALVAHQAFALAGTISRPLGEKPSADHAPLVKAAVCLISGGSLFETLLLNLHRYSVEGGEPFEGQSPTDAPAWERVAPTRPEDRSPTGYLDLLTWQSRRIRLLPEVDAAGRVGVRQVVIMKGYQFPDGFRLDQRETMVAFRRNLRAGAEEAPWWPLGFQEERIVWRDSLALVQSVAERQHRPKTVEWLFDLVAAGRLVPPVVVPLDLFGLSSDRAHVFFWRHERLPVPAMYLDPQRGPRLIEVVERGLTLAEETGRALDGAMARTAELVLTAGIRKADRRQVTDLCRGWGADRGYWARLETPFQRWLFRVAETPDVPEPEAAALAGWVDTVTRAAEDAYVEATRALEGSAREFRAVAEGGQMLRGRLGQLTAPYRREEREHAGRD